MSSPRSILILRFSSLGDLVLSTVLLDAVKKRHPQAQVTWVTKEVYATLLVGDSRIDHLVTLRSGAPLRDLARRVTDTSPDFDLVLDAHGSLRSRVLTALLPPTETRRVDKSTLDRWLHLRFGIHRPRLEQRQIDRFLELIPGAPVDLRPRILLPEPVERRAGVLAIAPGAKHQTKAWPLERFAETALAWCRQTGGRLRILGGEKELSRRLVDWLAAEGSCEVSDGSGSRDLLELATDLASCERLLCNDSGLLHLAEAVGTPAVALFGPTTRAWGYFPLDARSRVIETDLACRPCSRNGGRPCHLQHRLCMELLGVDEVLGALLGPAHVGAAT